MSYYFDAASTEYLEYSTGTILNQRPVTLSGWYRPDATGAGMNEVILSQSDKDSSARYHGLVYGPNGIGRAYISGYGNSDQLVATTNTATANAWSHKVASWTTSGSNELAEVILDGDTGGADSSSISNGGTITSNDRIAIGAWRISGGGGDCTGYIAECAIWSVDLTADEKAALAQGYSPLFIQPQNLTFYAPLWNDSIDILDPGRTVGTGGTPVVSPAIHPPMIYPTAAQLGALAVATGGLSIPIAMHHYTKNLRAAS